MENLVWIIPVVVVAVLVIFGIWSTARENAESERRASEYNSWAMRELTQFYIEFQQLKAGERSSTSRNRCFFVTTSGGTFHMHWMGAHSQLSQQVTGNVDVEVMRFAESKLRLR